MSLEALAKLVTYNPETGEFHALDGRPIGSLQSRGYVSIARCGRRALAHRLAWFIVTGREPSHIDHINRVRTDNRWSNLREADAGLNQCNRSVARNNTSGVPGVALDRHGRKWQAYIKRFGKRMHLGIYERFEDAVRVRKEAERLYFGEFAPQ